MPYRAPLAEMEFTARLVGQDALADTERFAEATPETRAAILDEAAKLAEAVLAPINRAGDLHPARLENGVVRCSPGFAEAYRAIADGGWVAIAADPAHGGMGLPQSFATMVNELMASGCLSISLNPLMTQGQIEALENHATDELKALCLPKLTAGEWTGTMNLTEPQAGSDVGALTTRAERRDDGAYAITGQKIYISWGDHDLAENVCHLVLARLPDGVPGTKGISLFLVPKYLPDESGRPGPANSLSAVSLEHKLGLHGSPTCVMEYDGATGWLVGEEHKGMACMFTMMNNARLGVGVQGLAVAEAALQQAAAFAAERRQGRTPDGSPTILGHADVRRMLMTMMAETQVMRAICYDCAAAIDFGNAADAEAVRRAEAGRGAFLTPIAKAFGTEAGCRVADLGIQVHGGMGYIEETGAAQLLRDARVTAIYEGTNGIQAMDLVGRKLSMDEGATARAVHERIAATADEARTTGEAALGDALAEAESHGRAATDWMLAAPEINERFAGATPYLRMMARLLGGHYLLKGALADRSRMPLARFYLLQMLPEAAALAAAATQGAAPLYDLEAERLSA